MMHMRLCVFFVCLLLASSLKPGPRKLNNLNDLRNSPYAKTFPRHGLMLLFFIAQRLSLPDQNNVFQANFDPTRRDFGFHRFYNHEQIVPRLPNLYSVGNINTARGSELSSFVRMDFSSSSFPENNRDRLLVNVIRNNPTRINRIFITSHTVGRNSFDSDETFEFDPALIQQIRRPDNISLMNFDDHLLHTFFHNTGIDLTSTFERVFMLFQEPGLAAFLTIAGYNVEEIVTNFIARYSRVIMSGIRSSYELRQYNEFEKMKLELRTTTNGFAKLVWENMPVKEGYSIQAAVCNANQHTCTDQGCYKETVRNSGFSDTSVVLNPGLQPQLLLQLCTSCDTIILYGPVFDEANGVIPTRLNGYDASLQLYTKDGWACARLYIKKTFSNWKDSFYYSWVGFYSDKQADNRMYKKYIYVVEMLKMEDGGGDDDYDIYQFTSNMNIAPGVQIRFLKDKKYDNVLARTVPWGDNPSISQ